MTTPWDSLRRAYSNGYSLWTYPTTPFLLTMNWVQATERAPWTEGRETWRVLHARFPGSIATHSALQDFFFGDDVLLRRHGGLPWDNVLSLIDRQAGAKCSGTFVELCPCPVCSRWRSSG
jgi:hypothetical protein